MTDAEATRVLDAQLGPGEARASCASAPGRRAAARCIATARACEAGRLVPVARLAFYALGETLVLDEATQSHLELVRSVDGGERGSLLGEIDVTKTAPGARLLRRRLLAPLAGVAEIRRRHDAVELVGQHPGTRREGRAGGVCGAPPGAPPRGPRAARGRRRRGASRRQARARSGGPARPRRPS